jgi:radical SAM protein with 4Fe4S-binding SPASM domain
MDAHTEETYKSIRGKGFETVKSNLLAFLEEKRKRNVQLPIVRVSFVDMSVNNREKDAFITFWRERVDIVDIQVFDNFNHDTLQQIDRQKAKKWDCLASWSRVAVLATGDILPCCNFFGRNIPIGNIRDSSITDAWNSEGMQLVREGIMTDSLNNCSVCQRIGE